MNFENDMNCNRHPIVNVDGAIETGTQFDLEVILPKDNRDAVFGIVKDCFKEPVCNAVVKLIEIEKCGDKKERKPVSHTFTNKDGEFVFGPLCPDKQYEVLVWVNQVKNVKLCAKSSHEMECLKGMRLDKCDFEVECKNECYKDNDKCKDICDCDKDCKNR